MEVLNDVSRLMHEQNRAQADKQPDPEIDEDGTYVDKEHQALVTLTDQQITDELLGDF